MTDQWTDSLSDYLDDELGRAERAALEAHLAGCAACRGVLDELRQVVARAQTLEDRAPARDLWSGIAREIGRGRGAARAPARRFSFSVPQLLAASIALVLLSAGAVWLSVARRPAPLEVALNGAGPARLAWASDPRYDAAIAELQAALDAGRRSGRLDSATIRVVEHNLAVIDTAIVQARRALAADPGSAYLNHHLADTMRRKLELLRQATAIAGART